MFMGLGKADITPREAMVMMGYGDRDHRSEGVHDPLWVYALYVEQKGKDPIVWFSTDVCLFGSGFANALKEEIAKATGIGASCMQLQGTHTHSGPNVYALHTESGKVEKAYFALLSAQFSKALKEAKASKKESYLLLRQGEGSIGVNRRGLDKKIDNRLFLLDAVDEKGTLLFSLFYYSCHLTALGVENYLISADWLDPVRTQYEKEHKVPLMFIQGAQGNIDPWTRGVLDMSDPDQAKGVDFAKVQQIGDRLYKEIDAIRSTNIVSTIKSLRFKSFTLALPLLFGTLSQEEIEQKIWGWKEEIGSFLGMKTEDVPENDTVNNLIKKKCVEIGASSETTEHLVRTQFTYNQFLWAYRDNLPYIDLQNGTMTIPVVVLGFGDLIIVGLPAEPLNDFNLDFAKQFPNKMVVASGLVNGYFGYFPHLNNFSEEQSEALYETISTVFAPHASTVVVKKVAEEIKNWH